MALRSEGYYKNIATTALSSIGVHEPPVPIDTLVAAMGIPVRPVNLPQFFTAAIIYEDGLPVFIVNWAKPEPERRRALAHMLGHVLLVLHGDGNTYARAAGDHSDADHIALELMMPSTMVIEQARLWFNDHRYLSRLFGVDETEMLDRMRDLGLIKGQQGVVWDF